MSNPVESLGLRPSRRLDMGSRPSSVTGVGARQKHIFAPSHCMAYFAESVGGGGRSLGDHVELTADVAQHHRALAAEAITQSFRHASKELEEICAVMYRPLEDLKRDFTVPVLVAKIQAAFRLHDPVEFLIGVFILSRLIFKMEKNDAESSIGSNIATLFPYLKPNETWDVYLYSGSLRWITFDNRLNLIDLEEREGTGNKLRSRVNSAEVTDLQPYITKSGSAVIDIPLTT